MDWKTVEACCPTKLDVAPVGHGALITIQYTHRIFAKLLFLQAQQAYFQVQKTPVFRYVAGRYSAISSLLLE